MLSACRAIVPAKALVNEVIDLAIDPLRTLRHTKRREKPDNYRFVAIRALRGQNQWYESSTKDTKTHEERKCLRGPHA